MEDHELRLNVADAVVSLTIQAGVRVAGYVDSFLVDAPPEAVVSVRFNRGEFQAEEWHPLVMGEDFGWKAYQTVGGDSLLIERLGGQILMRFASGLACNLVDVLLGTPDGGASSGRGWLDRELLLVEILPLPVAALLSGRKGLFLHSCAVSLAGEGVLFSGISGSGKSTMADLWRKFGPESSAVIDDEHLLARQVGATAIVYGAPWSRGPRRASFSRTPLKAIFFLSHAARNRCTRLSPPEAFAELLSQVFLPVWSREQLESVMETCSQLLGQVVCYRLEFVPDQEVVAFVQDVLAGSR